MPVPKSVKFRTKRIILTPRIRSAPAFGKFSSVPLIVLYITILLRDTHTHSQARVAVIHNNASVCVCVLSACLHRNSNNNNKRDKPPYSGGERVKELVAGWGVGKRTTRGESHRRPEKEITHARSATPRNGKRSRRRTRNVGGGYGRRRSLLPLKRVL